MSSAGACYQSSDTGIRRTSSTTRLRLGLIGGAVCLLYASTLRELWMVWSTREDYSHGFLIPLIAAYLIKKQWPDLSQLPPQPTLWLGIPVCIASLACLLIDSAGGIITLSSLSLLALSIGLVLMLLGRSWLRALLFPLGYLLFMFPVLDSVLEPLQWPFQLTTAVVAAALLTTLSIPTFRDGTMLHLPTGTVEVAAQCSGVGFLISILAIGLPLAYLGLRTWRARTVLLMATLLISICANWFRVALIALSGHYWGWTPDIHGPGHILQAMSVYWVGLGILLSGTWVAARLERPEPHRPPTHFVSPNPSFRSFKNADVERASWIAVGLLGMATVLLYAQAPNPRVSLQHLALFPDVIGEWTSAPFEQEAPILRIDAADEELVRMYRNTAGDRVMLSISYMASQKQGKELVNHRTNALHAAARETILSLTDRAFTVNRGEWTGSDGPRPFLFWYVLDGQPIVGRLSAKLTTIVQTLSWRGSHGALVLLSSVPSQHDLSGRAHTDPLQDFAVAVVPVLGSFLP